jgi:hypothetical protein
MGVASTVIIVIKGPHPPVKKKTTRNLISKYKDNIYLELSNKLWKMPRKIT